MPTTTLTPHHTLLTPFKAICFHYASPLFPSKVQHNLLKHHILFSCASPSQKPTSCKRPYGYWKDRRNIHAELKQYINEHKREPVMPTQSELLASGRADLAGAIHRYGPWKKTADELGVVLSSIAKPRSLNLVYCTTLRSKRLRPYMYWRNFENLRAELTTFMSVYCARRDGQCERVLPTAAELEAAGRSDLMRAIGKHGGWEAVAQKLNIQTTYRTNEYWNHFENVEEAVHNVAEEGTDEVPEGTMPSSTLLKKYGKQGLYSAIMRLYGGTASVARRIGLTMIVKKKPRGYWLRAENLRGEVLRCLRDICDAHPERDKSLMPLFAEFLSIGRADVYAAIVRAGGIAHVATQLGLRYSPVQRKSPLSK